MENTENVISLTITSICVKTFDSVLFLPCLKGTNAIWISPIVENTEKGYHGYWAKNIYTLNPKFGTEQDFKDLIKAAHEKDIWIMVDV